MMNSWRTMLVMSLVIMSGMAGVACAEPLLSPPEPFSTETPDSTQKMVIVVQELTNPLDATTSEEAPVLLRQNIGGEPGDVENEPASQQSDASEVPEPSTLLLVGLGLFGGLWGLKRYKRLTRSAK